MNEVISHRGSSLPPRVNGPVVGSLKMIFKKLQIVTVIGEKCSILIKIHLWGELPDDSLSFIVESNNVGEYSEVEVEYLLIGDLSRVEKYFQEMGTCKFSVLTTKDTSPPSVLGTVSLDVCSTSVFNEGCSNDVLSIISPVQTQTGSIEVSMKITKTSKPALNSDDSFWRFEQGQESGSVLSFKEHENLASKDGSFYQLRQWPADNKNCSPEKLLHSNDDSFARRILAEASELESDMNKFLQKRAHTTSLHVPTSAKSLVLNDNLGLSSSTFFETSLYPPVDELHGDREFYKNIYDKRDTCNSFLSKYTLNSNALCSEYCVEDAAPSYWFNFTLHHVTFSPPKAAEHCLELKISYLEHSANETKKQTKLMTFRICNDMILDTTQIFELDYSNVQDIFSSSSRGLTLEIWKIHEDGSREIPTSNTLVSSRLLSVSAGSYIFDENNYYCFSASENFQIVSDCSCTIQFSLAIGDFAFSHSFLGKIYQVKYIQNWWRSISKRHLWATISDKSTNYHGNLFVDDIVSDWRAYVPSSASDIFRSPLCIEKTKECSKLEIDSSSTEKVNTNEDAVDTQFPHKFNFSLSPDTMRFRNKRLFKYVLELRPKGLCSLYSLMGGGKGLYFCYTLHSKFSFQEQTESIVWWDSESISFCGMSRHVFYLQPLDNFCGSFTKLHGSDVVISFSQKPNGHPMTDVKGYLHIKEIKFICEKVEEVLLRTQSTGGYTHMSTVPIFSCVDDSTAIQKKLGDLPLSLTLSVMRVPFKYTMNLLDLD